MMRERMSEMPVRWLMAVAVRACPESKRSTQARPVTELVMSRKGRGLSGMRQRLPRMPCLDPARCLAPGAHDDGGGLDPTAAEADAIDQRTIGDARGRKEHVACRQIGPIAFKEKLGQGDEMFRKRRSFWFKKMQIVRGCDAARNVLVYLVYSDKLVDGSPKNSISTVPIMPWGADTNVPQCKDFIQ